MRPQGQAYGHLVKISESGEVLQSYQDATTSILQNEITNELRKTLASVISELDSVQASNILDNVLLKNGKQDEVALAEDTVGSNRSGQSGSDLDSLVLLDTKDVKLTKSRALIPLKGNYLTFRIPPLIHGWRYP